MKLDIKIKIIAVGILVIIAACLIVISRFDSHDEDIDPKVLKSLAGLRFQVYGCYRHLYVLNLNTGKWDIIAKNIGNNNGDEKSISIYDNSIYYYNPYNGYVESINISNTNEAVKVFKPLAEISLFESILVQKDRVLYTCKIGLCEYSLITKNQKILYDRDCLDFSSNGKDIFVATRNGIFNINQQDDIIAHGINIYALSNRRIACYDNKQSLIQILDLDSGKIVFSMEPQGALYSMTVDKDGEFICIGRILQKGLVTHKMGLTVYEVATGKEYKLPDFPIVTRCFILEQLIESE